MTFPERNNHGIHCHEEASKLLPADEADEGLGAGELGRCRFCGAISYSEEHMLLMRAAVPVDLC